MCWVRRQIPGSPHLENALDDPEDPLRCAKILCTVMVNVCISVRNDRRGWSVEHLVRYQIIIHCRARFFYNLVSTILIVHLKFNLDSNPWKQTICPCMSCPRFIFFMNKFCPQSCEAFPPLEALGPIVLWILVDMVMVLRIRALYRIKKSSALSSSTSRIK